MRPRTVWITVPRRCGIAAQSLPRLDPSQHASTNSKEIVPCYVPEPSPWPSRVRLL